MKRKNRIILWMSFLFVTAVCHAQQHKIDSLNSLISAATSDTQRINLINKKIAAFYDISVDSVLQLANKAVQESQTINYQPGEFRALVYLTAAYVAKGDSTGAKKNLDIASQFLKTTKDTIAIFNYYQNYGDMYGLEAKPDSSLVFYKKELYAIPSGSDTSWMPGIYMTIAGAYLQATKFSDALTYYRKTLAVAKNTNNENFEAYLYGNMANTFETMGDFAKAEQYGSSAIHLAKKTNEKSAEGYACTLVAQAYIGMHKYNEAYTYAMNAAELAKTAEYDYNVWEAADLSYAGGALAMMGKINEAKKLDSNAVIIADSTNLPFGIFVAYAAMGDLLRMVGKDKEAIPFYERSCKSVIGSNIYDPNVADTYTALSACYKQTGNADNAIQASKTAAEIRSVLKRETMLAHQKEPAMNDDLRTKSQATKK